MYDYRRLTEQQRAAIVIERSSRGFPWHRPPHPDLGSGWYFITGACFEHAHHFADPGELTALQRRLFEAIAETQCECGGWVILPNHYHLLVKLTDLRHSRCKERGGSGDSEPDKRPLAGLGKALGKVHGRSGVYANRRDGTSKRQVWYKYNDRKIRSERHYWASLHYMIINPIKHGYVDDPLKWPWSCVHECVAQNKPGWLTSLRSEYPIKDFGAGWDD